LSIKIILIFFYLFKHHDILVMTSCHIQTINDVQLFHIAFSRGDFTQLHINEWCEFIVEGFPSELLMPIISLFNEYDFDINQYHEVLVFDE
jgi:hypothetical protein